MTIITLPLGYILNRYIFFKYFATFPKFYFLSLKVPKFIIANFMHVVPYLKSELLTSYTNTSTNMKCISYLKVNL
jgi:hypothetical protein